MASPPGSLLNAGYELDTDPVICLYAQHLSLARRILHGPQLYRVADRMAPTMQGSGMNGFCHIGWWTKWPPLCRVVDHPCCAGQQTTPTVQGSGLPLPHRVADCPCSTGQWTECPHHTGQQTKWPSLCRVADCPHHAG